MAEEFAKLGWPFTEGEFLKNCMLKVCDVFCPDKKQMSNLSLTQLLIGFVVFCYYLFNFIYLSWGFWTMLIFWIFMILTGPFLWREKVFKDI